MTWLFFGTLVAANLVTWAISFFVSSLGVVSWVYIAVGLSIFLHIQVEYWQQFYGARSAFRGEMGVIPLMGASAALAFAWPAVVLFALAQEALAQMKHAARRAEERNE